MISSKATMSNVQSEPDYERHLLALGVTHGVRVFRLHTPQKQSPQGKADDMPPYVDDPPDVQPSQLQVAHGPAVDPHLYISGVSTDDESIGSSSSIGKDCYSSRSSLQSNFDQDVYSAQLKLVADVEAAARGCREFTQQHHDTHGEEGNKVDQETVTKSVGGPSCVKKTMRTKSQTDSQCVRLAPDCASWAVYSGPKGSAQVSAGVPPLDECACHIVFMCSAVSRYVVLAIVVQSDNTVRTIQKLDLLSWM